MYDDRPEIQARLQHAVVAWLTTVNADGQPQSSVVWFVAADDAIVVYSKDRTPRLRNIRANPRVCFNLNSDPDGDDPVIVEGEAEIIGSAVPPSAHAGYAAKYAPHLSHWDFTWESYDPGFPVRIHIRPTRLRQA